MKIVCPNCKFEYRVPDDKIPAKGASTRCKNCRTRIIVAKEPASGFKDIPVKPQNTEKNSVNRSVLPAAVAEKEAASEGSLNEPEHLVEQYIKQDNQEAAAELLFELIVKHAREKNFNKAESLRDKLYEAAPG
jgi:predicted Zn finger-like uncharacterized protein